MATVILDYDAGNQTSVLRALAHLGHAAAITADPAAVAAADRVVFPGVGAAGSCMARLRERGVDGALRAALARGVPVLCVCVGLQLLFEHSEEDDTPCLGLLPGRVVRFRPADPAIKVPHMGWNPVTWTPGEPLAAGIDGASMYFVHSFHAVPGPGVRVVAESDHGGRFCAAVRRDNLVAAQFHPEKSGPAGLRLLANFLAG